VKLRTVSAFLVAVVAFALVSCGGTTSSVPAPGPAQQQSWLLTSDWHFNPYDDPKLVNRLVHAPANAWHRILAESPNPPSRYFTDTNFALLESALGAMHAVVPNPPAVLIGGDTLAHHFRDNFFKYQPGAPESAFESFVDKTFAFLALEFDATYPRAQFLITLGNNDGYCGNYKSTPKSPFLAHLARAWEPLVNRNGAAPGFVADFSDAGYYTARLPSQPAIPAIVLNSVFWSALYENSCGDRASDPGAAELRWLASQLGSSSARPLLLTHIPFGIDEYASINANKATPLYRVKYTRRLLAILAAKGIGLRAFVIGHIHHATFEIADTGIGKLGAIIMPSITPSQGNNPAFTIGTISPTAPTIVDTTTYVLPLPQWQNGWIKLYSFNQAYGLTGYDAQNLLKLQATMARNERVRRQFFHYYNSASTTATPNPDKWFWYWCGHVHLTPPPYAKCLAQH
jgi:sphingomyelin phosphodiesterase acid-like 3